MGMRAILQLPPALRLVLWRKCGKCRLNLRTQVNPRLTATSTLPRQYACALSQHRSYSSTGDSAPAKSPELDNPRGSTDSIPHMRHGDNTGTPAQYRAEFIQCFRLPVFNAAGQKGRLSAKQTAIAVAAILENSPDPLLAMQRLLAPNINSREPHVTLAPPTLELELVQANIFRLIKYKSYGVAMGPRLMRISEAANRAEPLGALLAVLGELETEAYRTGRRHMRAKLPLSVMEAIRIEMAKLPAPHAAQVEAEMAKACRHFDPLDALEQIYARIRDTCAGFDSSGFSHSVELRDKNAHGTAKELTAHESHGIEHEVMRSRFTPPLKDVTYVAMSHRLPSEQVYPNLRAFSNVLSLIHAENGIKTGCEVAGIPIQVEVEYSTEERLLDHKMNTEGLCREISICVLRIEIQDICQLRSVGEGLKRKGAKQAAWLRLVSDMHENGTLRTLLSHSRINPADRHEPERSDIEAPIEDDEPLSKDTKAATIHKKQSDLHGPLLDEHTTNSELQPDEIDDPDDQIATINSSVLREEKDAKLDIYNYAASFGATPYFNVSIVQPRTKRERTSRNPKNAVRVDIRVPQLNIVAFAVGVDLFTAQIAAALAFKREAERMLTIAEPEDSHKKLGPYSVLSNETAWPFFDFYREIQTSFGLEVEVDSVAIVGVDQYTTRVVINGEAVGEPFFMRSKKQAKEVALLMAAVDIARSNPQLIVDFAKRLKEGKGKLLQEFPPVGLPLSSGALSMMRSGLLGARSAGLPDGREILVAAQASLERLENESSERRIPLDDQEVEDLSRKLMAEHEASLADTTLDGLRSKTGTLPMNLHRSEVLEMVSQNPYSIIVGATGSGKTTQVPQILLDDAIERGIGGKFRMFCTQPRRIATTSVAQRVAEERNEPLQQSVGYHIRFDMSLPRQAGSITYCTTGVLLQQLKHDPDPVLDSLSHIVVDEVHERDLQMDFLMTVLKRALQARKAARKHVPKVILMSATLDTAIFAKYFSATKPDGSIALCPSLKVPGRSFPVTEQYLESILHDILDHDPAALKALLARHPPSKDYLDHETSFSSKASSPQTDPVIDWKREYQTHFSSGGDVGRADEKKDAIVPCALLAATIAHVCKTTKEGAILVFLPGLLEITETRNILMEAPIFGQDFAAESRFKICVMHSAVPREQQQEIFKPVPERCRKIILSTNIAETSVTVADVQHVIDAGKLREKRYDPTRRLSALQCVWESKSNSRQRAGRAGRVQNGHYYALFSKERYDSLRATRQPELMRTDLQETALAIKLQGFEDSVEGFLNEAIEPPPIAAVKAAVNDLIAIEALTDDEEVTDLGRLLAQLPIHPTFGKMIVMGIIFRCLDPMLRIAFATIDAPLFVFPIDRTKRVEAEHIRRVFENESASDHIAILNAFAEIKTVARSGGQAASNHSDANWLNYSAYTSIDRGAEQVARVLRDKKLIPELRPGESWYSHGGAAMNRNSKNLLLIKGLLSAGLYPNLAASYASKSSRALHRTSTEQGVVLHPTSLNANTKRSIKHPDGTLFAYGTLSKSADGNSLFMRNTTIVTPLMAALFCGRLDMPEPGKLKLDGWLPLDIGADDPEYAAQMLLEFRKGLDRVLHSAYRSLSSNDPDARASFAHDPIRQQFTDRVVEVLNQADKFGNFEVPGLKS